MALSSERITLPRGPGSLRQLVQCGSWIARLDASGSTWLVDTSAKKPAIHEVPTLTLGGEGNDANRAFTAEAGGFSADGKHFALLRAGAAGLRLPSIEVLDVATRTKVHGFELKMKAPYNVQWHPDGERLYVSGNPETVVFSLKGKVLDRIGTDHGFELSPLGTQYLIKVSGSEWVVRPHDKPKFVKVEANDITFADEETLVFSGWSQTDKTPLFKAPTKTGKAKKLLVLEQRPSSLVAFGSRALAVLAGDKKVFAQVIELKNGRAQRKELQGAPSGTAASMGADAAYVQVNWSKTLHRLTF
ncbi:MAG: hypothetical protein QM817_18135 [Archangium sp.]